MTDHRLLVAVKCECCSSFDKTQNTPMVGDFRRMVEIWRCDICGLPCSNRRCDGFQSDNFEDRP